MNTYIYLSTCNTCMRILKELDLPEETQLQDVKQQPISASQLQELYDITQSYEALINKRSKVYAALKKEGTVFDEALFKKLLLTAYSCLKRPVLFWNGQYYIGNAKNTVAMMQQAVHGE
ncbi:MAG: arsenate reductase family protein [Flavobacteriaceae bacterium]